jgi:hypothetical protein
MAIKIGRTNFFHKQSGGVDGPQELHIPVRYTGQTPVDLRTAPNIDLTVDHGDQYPNMITIKRLPK